MRDNPQQNHEVQLSTTQQPSIRTEQAMYISPFNLWIVGLLVWHQVFASSQSDESNEALRIDAAVSRHEPRMIEDELRVAVGIMTQNDELHQENKMVKRANEEQKDVIRELRSTINEQEVRINTALRGIHATFDQLKIEKAQLVEKVAELESEAIRHQSFVVGLQQESTEWERDSMALLARINVLESERDSEVVKNAALQSDNDGLKTQIEQSKDDQVRLVFKNAALEVKNEQITRELQQLIEEKEAFRNLAEASEERTQRDKRKIAQLEAEKVGLGDCIGELTRENKMIKEQKEESTKDRAEALERIIALESKNEKLESNIKEMKGTHKVAGGTIDRGVQANLVGAHKVVGLGNKVQEQRVYIEQLVDSGQAMRKDFKSQREKSATLIGDLENKISALEHLEKETKEIQKQRTLICEVQKENGRLTQQRDERARDRAVELLHIKEMEIEHEKKSKEKDVELAALRIQLKTENSGKEGYRRIECEKHCTLQ